MGYEKSWSIDPRKIIIFRYLLIYFMLIFQPIYSYFSFEWGFGVLGLSSLEQEAIVDEYVNKYFP